MFTMFVHPWEFIKSLKKFAIFKIYKFKILIFAFYLKSIYIKIHVTSIEKWNIEIDPNKELNFWYRKLTFWFKK
jgi:hypothetical protein